MDSSFQKVRHLVPGAIGPGTLIRCGAKRESIWYTTDTLSVGPCSDDPERHQQLRRLWNREMPSQLLSHGDLRQAASWDGPIVIWATRAYKDIIWLFWVLDGIARLGQLSDRLLIVRPDTSGPPHTMDTVGAELASSAFSSAQLATADAIREGAELWKLFSSPWPLGFDEARRAIPAAFPELGTSGELYGAWFPRSSHESFRPSEFDEQLLHQLNGQWQTTARILENLPTSHRIFEVTDSFFPIRRLRAWSAVRVVEREVRQHVNPLEQDAFRITSVGRSLLEQVNMTLSDIPQMYVGGCAVNHPDVPWVRVGGPSGWRIHLNGLAED